MYDDAGSDPSNLESDVTFNHAAAHASIFKFKSAVASVVRILSCIRPSAFIYTVTITLYSFFPSRFLQLQLPITYFTFTGTELVPYMGHGTWVLYLCPLPLLLFYSTMHGTCYT